MKIILIAALFIIPGVMFGQENFMREPTIFEEIKEKEVYLV